MPEPIFDLNGRFPRLGWVYDTRGKLVGVPDERFFHHFDKADNGLPRVATETWEGFVFVNLHPEPAQTLDAYLGELGERLRGFPHADLTARYAYRTELRCNWKVAPDAFSEGYHVNTIHGRSYPDTFIGKNNPLCHLPEVRLYGPHRTCRTASTSRAFARCTPTGRRLRNRLPWRKPGGRP